MSVCTLLTFRAELCFRGWHWLDSSWQTCCNFFYKQRVIELVVSRYFSSIMSGSKFIQFFTIGGLIGHTVFEEFRQNKILWLIFLLTSTFWCHFKNYIDICLIKLVILAILSVCCSVIKRHAYCCTTITLSISEHFRLPQINLCSKHLTPQPLSGHGKKYVWLVHILNLIHWALSVTWQILNCFLMKEWMNDSDKNSSSKYGLQVSHQEVSWSEISKRHLSLGLDGK